MTAEAVLRCVKYVLDVAVERAGDRGNLDQWGWLSEQLWRERWTANRVGRIGCYDARRRRRSCIAWHKPAACGFLARPSSPRGRRAHQQGRRDLVESARHGR
jgi:hypothetical protein